MLIRKCARGTWLSKGSVRKVEGLNTNYAFNGEKQDPRQYESWSVVRNEAQWLGNPITASRADVLARITDVDRCSHICFQMYQSSTANAQDFFILLKSISLIFNL